MRNLIYTIRNRRLNTERRSPCDKSVEARRNYRCPVRTQGTMTRNPRDSLQLTPTRNILRVRPSALTLRFRGTSIYTVLFTIMNPRVDLLYNNQSTNDTRPRCRYRDTRNYRRETGHYASTPSLRNNPSPTRKHVQLHFQPRHRQLLRLFRLNTTNFAFNRVLFRRHITNLANSILHVRQRRIASSVAVHFRHLLPSFFVTFRPGGTRGRGTLRISTGFLRSRPFSYRGGPPLI